ncbi:hypothetical protein ACH5RR_033565 [Cinchona calisaya]|uniref:Uncharacterized protein n=1 Tax=Cinchona calisaya TaxID=153742 RepID=A0ABD2YLC4_9GENT
MKILVILSVALVLTLGAFQANAKRVFPMQERQLLSDANLGRKVSVGPNHYKVVAIQNPKTTTTRNEADDDDAVAADSEVNGINQGDDSGTTSHRYFPDDQPQPMPGKNNVNTPRHSNTP